MFLNRKGQSTAEYAIVIGLVIAVAAGALQIALKGGIRQKNKQAMDHLINAGDDLLPTAGASEKLFSQDYRKTTVDHATYRDTTVTHKGGAAESYQRQDTDTTAISVELIDAMSDQGQPND